MRLRDFSFLLKKTSVVFAIVSLVWVQAAGASRQPEIAPPTKKHATNTKTTALLGSSRSSVKGELSGAAINLQPSTLSFDDCEVCHDQCLAASLTCIALAIATGCLICGPLCLAGQAACQYNCNQSSACQPKPPAN